MTEMMRLKYTVKLRTDVGQYTSEDTYIGMENVESQTGRYVETDSTYNDGTYCIVKKDDVLFGKLRPYLAKVLICDFDGFSTNEFLTFSDFSGDKRFLFYWLLSDGFVKLVDSSTYGTKMPRASWDFIRNTLIPLPELAEQSRIVAYLDRRTAEIDTLIADLQSQMEMLDRYKRELIAEVITKGLNKSATMKDSGVDYIGAIPETWEATKNKWLFRKVKNIVGSDQENYPVLSLSIKGVIEKDREDNTGKIPTKYEEYYQVVEHGNLLLCLFDMDVTPCIIGYIPQNGIVSPAYSHYAPTNTKAVSMKFYYWWFLYMQHRKLFIALSNNIRNSINADHFGALESPQPPIDEQERIAAYLDERIAKIEGLITDITAQIEKLKQYRQIVIHDAVTGKVKVKEG